MTTFSLLPAPSWRTVHRIDVLYLCFQKLLPGQGLPNLPSPPEGLKNLPYSLCAQQDIELQQFALNSFHTPEQVIVFHGQDQVLDIRFDRLATSLRRTVFKGPEPLQQCSLPGEKRFRLDQRQSVLDIGRPVQDNQEQLVVDVEMDPLLPPFPCQDLVLFL